MTAKQWNDSLERWMYAVIGSALASSGLIRPWYCCEGMIEDGRKAVEQAIGFLYRRRAHHRLPAGSTMGGSAGRCRRFRRRRRNHKGAEKNENGTGI